MKVFLAKWRGPLWLIAISLFIFWGIFGRQYQFTLNVGDSMRPTFSDKEWIIVQKRSSLDKGWGPQRFDVVLIENPDGASWGGEETLNKRIIGLPGERIEIKEGYIFLNGRKLNDPFGGNRRMAFYLIDEDGNDLYYWGTENKVKNYVNKKEIIIPKSQVWLIGDNREISWFGVLPTANIKALVIF
jgi:signal peptidase I